MGSNVVDYEAWKKGYTPPTEHVLIDQLAYRGARVVSMSSVAKGFSWWLVVRGDCNRKRLAQITRRLHEEMFDTDQAAVEQGRSAPDEFPDEGV